jgi:hypothetical protein
MIEPTGLSIFVYVDALGEECIFEANARVYKKNGALSAGDSSLRELLTPTTGYKPTKSEKYNIREIKKKTEERYGLSNANPSVKIARSDDTKIIPLFNGLSLRKR